MAAEHGASRREIAEATAVALALGGGVAQWPARFVFKVMDDLELPDEPGLSADADTLRE